jgi:RimJ/RimL family protein N-acetyltransferase
LFDEWRVRSFELRDAESIARYANNRNIWRNVRDAFPHPYFLSDAKKFLNSQFDREIETAWAIASSTEAIGAIGLHPQHDVYRGCAEVGYWLAEPFWGKGIATAAVKAMVEHAFANTDFIRLYAGVFEWNAASARVLEKAGFALESRMRRSVVKDGKVIDQLMYVLLKDARQTMQDGSL